GRAIRSARLRNPSRYVCPRRLRRQLLLRPHRHRRTRGGRGAQLGPDATERQTDPAESRSGLEPPQHRGHTTDIHEPLTTTPAKPHERRRGVASDNPLSGGGMLKRHRPPATRSYTLPESIALPRRLS